MHTFAASMIVSEAMIDTSVPKQSLDLVLFILLFFNAFRSFNKKLIEQVYFPSVCFLTTGHV